MGNTILVVDDEKSIINGITVLLEEEGYSCRVAFNGEEAVNAFDEERPDIVVLDIMMPKKNGFQTCQEIRERDANVPILLLSAKGDIVDKSIGFKAGADDYVTKPFLGEELVLRIDALLRRSDRERSRNSQGSRSIARIGALEVHFKRQKVYLNGEVVDLTPKEYLILATMADRPGRVFTTKELVERVWGDDFVGEVTSVAVYIRRLREKIEENPSKPEYLTTVWRVGYRLGGGDNEI